MKETEANRAPRKRGRPSNREKEGRAKRVPMGTPELKMSVPQAEQDKDHVYRWFNDKPGRLQRAQNAGYEFVEDPTIQVGEGSESKQSNQDARVSMLAGKDERGGPLYAYLMRIKREWYEDDQDVKQAAIDEIDEAIQEGRLNEEAGEARYVPKEGIKIR